MNPCGKGERNKNPIASPFLPRSSQQLKAAHPEQNSCGQKSVRVKRRRTRRERNYVKFGRNGTDCVLEQRPSCMGLQKALPPFWSSQLKVASFKGICGAKPVIITQNRLSQHLGMFNKEVKSVNIERLLNLRCEQERVEVTHLRRDSGVNMQLGEDSQTGKSGGSGQKSVPSEQLGSHVNNPSGTNENSVPAAMPTISAVLKELRAPVHARNTGSQSLAAPAAVEENQQSGPEAAEPDPSKSDAPLLTNEKENVPPVSPEGAESHEGKTPARQLAHDFRKLLDLKAIFPGRNLINETRQTIISALLEQKQKLPKFSDFALHKKLASSSMDDAVQADFRTPAGRDEELRWESISTSDSSRNSGPGVSLKKRRGRDLFFLTSPIPSPTHTAVRMDEERPSLRAGVDFFTEAKEFDQLNCPAALRPHPPLPSSRRVNSREDSSFASGERCPLKEPLLRTISPWREGLRDALWEPRSRRERSKAAYRPLQKNSVPQSLPFSTWNPAGLANATTGDKFSSQFPVADSQQPSYYVNQPRSERWTLQEAESVPVHRQYLFQERCGSQTLSLGSRPTERAASESQTSFDVLKSIWSPNRPSSGARFPMPKALCCRPLLAHQTSPIREPNSDQEEFLQLYSTSPRHHRSTYREIPRQEIHVPSRYLQNRRQVCSAVTKPRTHCQKVALERGKASNSYQHWGMMETASRTRGTREEGYASRSRDQACCPEMLSQMAGMQQLQRIQQLPMSYFPPSEALENMHSPHHSFQSHALGQFSPEPWAFPRMKLY